MTNEANLRSKALYKITLYVLKMLPMIMAFSYLTMFVLANTVESLVIVPHILGTVIAPLVFIYLTSYVFRFCAFHRLFIHYYAFVELLNVTDYYIGIPISASAITFIHDSVTIVFLILAVVMYIYKYKKDKCLKQYNNKEYDFRNS